jgi:hypothetical protein
MAGNTGEAKRDRLKRLAAGLRPPPDLAPYYVQLPDGQTTRSPGWHMRRNGEIIYLGYSATDAEIWIREQLLATSSRKRRRKPTASSSPRVPG